MRKFILLFIVAAFVLAGCGRKEPPQPVTDAPAPTITMFKQAVLGNALQLNVKIAGGNYGVGYQVDRSEIDPGCNCPSFWRRYHEEAPSAKNFNKELSMLIRLMADTKYAFRVRAIDGAGRFSEWSKPFFAESEKFFE